VRYYYYGHRPREIGAPAAERSPALRIPAREIEPAVCDALARLVADPLELASRAGLLFAPGTLPQLEQRGTGLAGKLRARDGTTVRTLLSRVRVLPARFELALNRAGLASLLGLDLAGDAEPVFIHCVALQLTRTGRAMRLVQERGQTATPPPPADTLALVRLIARGRQWWKRLGETGLEIRALAANEGVTASYMTRVVRLAFLSPQVVEAAHAGELRTGIDAATLLRPGAIMADWQEQAREWLPLSS
jgi:hypothetical protein